MSVRSARRRVRPLLLGLGLLALAAAAAAGQAGPTGDGVVRGSVSGRFEERAGPLPWASVEAWTVGVRRSVVADSLGRYELRGLPAGLIRIRVTHAGHHPSVLDVLVPAGGTALVDVELRARPVELPALDVTAGLDVPDVDERDAGSSASLAEVEVAALGAGAGLTEAGMAEAMRGLPGNDPAQATDVLFMRGSTTDLKLVLLDGAPVYTPFHVAGLLRSFEPAALGRAELHMGGAPARYDGGLTYILDLRTRRPGADRTRASGHVDLLSAGASADGPLGEGAGFVASTRALHDLASGPLGSSPYGYRDALVALEAEPAEGQRVRATGFLNRESVLLDLPTPSRVAPDEDAWWSNRALSVGWNGRVGGLLGDVTVAGGRYDASLPLQPSPPEAGDPLPDPLLARASHDRLRAAAELARVGPDGVVRVGVTGEVVETAYEAGPFGAPPSSSTAAEARSAGGYVDVTRRLSPELTVRGGLRADGLSGAGGGLLLAPRAALTWTLGPRALLTVAAGRFHQHARAPSVEVERAISDVVGEELPPDELLPVATADHLVLSLDQEVGDRTRLGLEGFWKGYQGLGEDDGDRIRSSGVDLRVQRLGEDLSVWLGYGLSWFWSTGGASTGGGSGSDDFSGRHLLSAGVQGRLAGAVGGELRVAYGAGLPYTSIPFGAADEDGLSSQPDPEPTPEARVTEGPLVGGLDEAFLRVDVELNADLTPSVGGREWSVRPYLRLLNALDRRDALFYAFNRDGGVAPLSERSLIPVLGVRWRF